MEKDPKMGQDQADMYQPKELAKRLGRSHKWVTDNASKLPGARETFPGSGIWVFLRRTVDAYYGW